MAHDTSFARGHTIRIKTKGAEVLAPFVREAVHSLTHPVEQKSKPLFLMQVVGIQTRKNPRREEARPTRNSHRHLWRPEQKSLRPESHSSL